MVYTPPGVYPFRGMAYLCTHPGLGKRVAMFLIALFSVSAIGVLVLAVTTFKSQLRLVGHSFVGSGIVGKLVTCLLILIEASIPVFLAFQQTMKAIQKRLFLDVLHGTLCSAFITTLIQHRCCHIGSYILPAHSTWNQIRLNAATYSLLA